MIKALLDLLISKYSYSLIRHINSTLGGILIASGAEQAIANNFVANSEQFYFGLFQVLASIIVSFLDKKSK